MYSDNSQPSTDVLLLMGHLFRPNKLLFLGPVSSFLTHPVAALPFEGALVVSPMSEEHLHVGLSQAIELRENCFIGNGDEATVYRANLRRESGLLDPVKFSSIWQNIRSEDKERVSTTTFSEIAKEADAIFDWVVTDHLVPVGHLEALGSSLAKSSVVISRLVSDSSKEPSLSRLSNIPVAGILSEYGFSQVATLPSRNSMISHFVFAKDYPSLYREEHQRNEEAFARLKQTQTRAAQLLDAHERAIDKSQAEHLKTEGIVEASRQRAIELADAVSRSDQEAKRLETRVQAFEEKLYEKSNQLGSLSVVADELHDVVVEQAQKIASENQKRSIAEEKIVALEAELVLLRERVLYNEKEYETRVADLGGLLHEKQAEADSLSAELDLARTSMQQTAEDYETQLNAAQSLFEQKQNEACEATEQLNLLSVRMRTTEEDLIESIETLEDAQRRANEEAAKANEEVSALQHRLQQSEDDYGAKIESLQTALEQKQAELTALIDANKQSSMHLHNLTDLRARYRKISEDYRGQSKRMREIEQHLRVVCEEMGLIEGIEEPTGQVE